MSGRVVVALIIGLALGVGGTLGVQALTDEDSGSDQPPERTAAFARCVGEAQDGDTFLAGEEQVLFGSDETPERATAAERDLCAERADRVVP